MKTFFTTTTLIAAASYSTFVASEATLPWDGDFTALTTDTLDNTYQTNILTNRAEGAGSIEDYVSLDAAVCTMSIDSNAVYGPAGEIGTAQVLRTDLSQAFTHPEAGTLMYEATISKAEAFTDEKQYEVFFLEGDDLDSKMFELFIHQETDGPKFDFRIRGTSVWEESMELLTDYHFQVYADAENSIVSLWVAVGSDAAAEVATESADITMEPEMHWGILFHDEDAAATLTGTESLSFSNLRVSVADSSDYVSIIEEDETTTTEDEDDETTEDEDDETN